MYLFQLLSQCAAACAGNDLHSTMYLFQLSIHSVSSMNTSDLHSTMYLFQHLRTSGTVQPFQIYIPLCIYFNMCRLANEYVDKLHLHSTMYLFQLQSQERLLRLFRIYIPLCIYFNLYRTRTTLFSIKFTFHYVSISTIQHSSCVNSDAHLHSTMYLFQQ